MGGGSEEGLVRDRRDIGDQEQKPTLSNTLTFLLCSEKMKREAGRGGSTFGIEIEMDGRGERKDEGNEGRLGQLFGISFGRIFYLSYQLPHPPNLSISRPKTQFPVVEEGKSWDWSSAVGKEERKESH